MGLLEGADLDLPCPKCGKKTRKTWESLKDEPEGFDCAHCNTHVVLDYKEAQGLGDALSGVDDSIEDLKRTFKQINDRQKRGR